jgi:hypothetical protein
MLDAITEFVKLCYLLGVVEVRHWNKGCGLGVYTNMTIRLRWGRALRVVGG